PAAAGGLPGALCRHMGVALSPCRGAAILATRWAAGGTGHAPVTPAGAATESAEVSVVMHDGDGNQDSMVPPVSSLALARRRVLVAEDDPSLRRLIVTVLEQAGYDVTAAQDGAELLEHIENLVSGQQSPSDSFVVVTDVNMPKLTGLDVLAVLRCASART